MTEPKNKARAARYRAIEKDLREQIQNGRWPIGAMFPSQRDLAREYGVSSVTVGRAVQSLIAEGTLHADTRRGTFVARTLMSKAVDQAGEKSTRNELLDTEGDLNARKPITLRRSLQGQTVGIIAASYTKKLSQDTLILSAIEQSVSEAGCITHMYNRATKLYGQLAPLQKAIEAILRERIDSLVIIALDLDRNEVEAALSRLDFDNIPTVCVLAGELHLPIPHVFYDNRIGGYQAAKHLIDLGHRELTVIAPSTASWVTERIAGITHAATQTRSGKVVLNTIAETTTPWNYLEDSTLGAYELTTKSLESGWKPAGGIIAVNDLAAFGVQRALSEAGYRSGKDYGLLGFDDDPRARMTGLSTLRPPLEAMGKEAARLLLDEISGIRVNQQVRLRGHLIPRFSTNVTG